MAEHGERNHGKSGLTTLHTEELSDEIEEILSIFSSHSYFAFASFERIEAYIHNIYRFRTGAYDIYLLLISSRNFLTAGSGCPPMN